MHVKHVTSDNIRTVIVRNADRKSCLHTDEGNLYPKVDAEFAAHERVKHSMREYARRRDDQFG
jgi:hypothetical protein